MSGDGGGRCGGEGVCVCVGLSGGGGGLSGVCVCVSRAGGGGGVGGWRWIIVKKR